MWIVRTISDFIHFGSLFLPLVSSCVGQGLYNFELGKREDNDKVNLPIERQHIVEVNLLIDSGVKLPGFNPGSITY